jgi:surfactin synthase thioesterase subunit
MKLLDDHDCLRNLKAMAIANERLIRVQEYYRISIATFRSDFIVRYNINDFHFSDIPQQERRRFWNSLKFHSSMIKGYYDVIHETKRIYENVLDTMPVLEK